MNRFEFLPGALVANGKTFPAEYENLPGRVVIVAEMMDNGKKSFVRIEVPETDINFPAAFAVAENAAQKQEERPETIPETEPAPAESSAAADEPAQEQEERPETISKDDHKEEGNRMKTYEEWKALPLETRSGICKALNDDARTLEKLYKSRAGYCSGKPAETIKEFVSAVGYDRALAVVGTLVNHFAWDGRISKQNVSWAAGLDLAYDDKAASCMGIDISVHRAHLDQLAEALRNLDPETIPETEPAPAESSAAVDEPAQGKEERPETIPETEPAPAESSAAADEPAQEKEERPETIPETEPAPAESSAAADEPAQKQEERPETIPEAEPAPAESSAAVDEPAQEQEAAARPVKEKTFAGDILTGDGWTILFDTVANRTRVIVSSARRDALRPVIEEAGFFWSARQMSWNKKLTHRAYRAALSLADSLRAIA